MLDAARYDVGVPLLEQLGLTADGELELALYDHPGLLMGCEWVGTTAFGAISTRLIIIFSPHIVLKLTPGAISLLCCSEGS